MKARLKTVLRKIMPSLIWQMLSLFKQLVFNWDAKGLRSIKFLKDKQDVIVLGNGPSLKKDLEKIAIMAEQHDFVCVNNFCSSPYYETFKPNKYVFLDGYFFSENAHPDWVKQREETFKIINERTTWKMQIFLPMWADKTILERIIVNPNVEIIKIKVFGNNHKTIQQAKRIYATGFFGPQQCNVLIYAVYLSVWAKHKKVKIFGADLSFHNDVQVNQENNHLEIRFRHFNKEDHVERLMKNPEKVEPFTMAEIMQTTADTFRAHEILNAFANYKNIEIINVSYFSMIDTYKRGNN
ncbi:hypothetical protein P0F19_002412 [Vibrio metschnikovii]|nr:hypothetical protein [Vibrio metschnikovii]